MRVCRCVYFAEISGSFAEIQGIKTKVSFAKEPYKRDYILLFEGTLFADVMLFGRNTGLFCEDLWLFPGFWGFFAKM